MDELFAEWKAAQAKIVSEAEDKPWKLREFMAADLDGNLIRAYMIFARICKSAREADTIAVGIEHYKRGPSPRLLPQRMGKIYPRRFVFREQTFDVIDLEKGR